MKLEQPFLRLPIRFDATALAAEVAALPDAAWRPHPQGYPGNSAVPLVAAFGDPGNDAARGPMRPTPWLAELPYVRQVMADLGVPVGRSRLMRIIGNGEAHAHVDTNAYWLQRHRIHVPVVTTPQVRFEVGDRVVHMAAGECWVFDTWRRHNVVNPEPTARIHLVIDTVGSAAFAGMLARAECPDVFHPGPDASARWSPARGEDTTPVFESVNQAPVMSPFEVRHWLAFALAHLREPAAADWLRTLFDMFAADWTATYAAAGVSPSAPGYARALERFEAALQDLPPALALDNGIGVAEFLRHAIVRVARDPEPPAPARAVAPAPASVDLRPRFDRPVFVISPPRSGSSLLFETLCRSPDVWSIGGEAHGIFEQLPALNPARQGFIGNAADASAAQPMAVAELTHGLFSRLRDRNGRTVPVDARALRLVEKTPKNALRVPFLAAAWPDAQFVLLHRNPRDTISSMLDAWQSGRFVTYPHLPDWPGPPWSLLLPPGWRTCAGAPLARIVAWQWSATVTAMLDALSGLDPARVAVVRHEDLVAAPQPTFDALCARLGLRPDLLPESLPLARHTLTPPDPDKWRRHAAALDPVLPELAPVIARYDAFVAGRGEAVAAMRSPPPVHGAAGVPVVATPAPTAARPSSVPPPAKPSAAPPPDSGKAFGSVHTRAFAEILSACPGTLAASTYQSGRVVLLRPEDQGVNTHFRAFPSPMGLAVANGELAIATARGIWAYHDQRAIADSLSPPGRHDACFVPRRYHVTGDIRVHEVVFAEGGLWLANTRFSCLGTIDAAHSFVPRWQPRFVSALEPTDRCHLNGIAVADGRVAYVTCLAATDAAGAWREHKADGGVIVDVASGEIVARGLSMPHSPRWHQGRLWVLESGKGRLSTVDPASGSVTPVADLPGFVRGLAFAGPFAFIGLSQIREGVFGGLPILDRVRERLCGVWAVDLRSGAIAGFLRFEGQVQELFDLQWLGGCRYPELFEPDDDRVHGAFVVPSAGGSRHNDGLTEPGTPP